MNILIPDKWLREHLETEATPEQIAEYVSLCGPTIERIEQRNGEPVYDIEVTTNRVDMMSVRGFARECAAILPEFEISAVLKEVTVPAIEGSREPLGITIENDPELCERILAVKLSGVKLKSSPDWLVQRLEQVDQRGLNNAIDITNYVMWEWGHPIHAFDYDRLVEKKIVIREAHEGEKFETLDHKTFVCAGGEVVFDDGTGNIIDLPGIMGTANTVVTDETKNVLLWIESIDARKIREASMRHQIRSQAAVLNEKDVDPNMADVTMARAVELFESLADAKVASELYDDYPGKVAPEKVEVSQSKIDGYMGISLPPEQVAAMMQRLEIATVFDVETKTYTFLPPSFRASDLMISEDFIEEIARLYGYFKLPSRLMKTALPVNERPSVDEFYVESYVKQLLSGWGGFEIYTYSLVSAELAAQSGYAVEAHLKLANPYSDDWQYLRRSLIPSHLEFMQENSQYKGVLFELANIYNPGEAGELPDEHLQLVLSTSGEYGILKGILEALIDKGHAQLQVEPLEAAPSSLWMDNRVGEVLVNGVSVGYIGQVHADVVTYAVQLDYAVLLGEIRRHPYYRGMQKYPAVIQDITIELPERTYLGPVIDRMYGYNDLIKKVQYVGVYEGAYTFRLYFQADDRNLSDDDVNAIREDLIMDLA